MTDEEVYQRYKQAKKDWEIAAENGLDLMVQECNLELHILKAEIVNNFLRKMEENEE